VILCQCKIGQWHKECALPLISLTDLKHTTLAHAYNSRGQQKMGSFNCFKAYDIRGRIGDELDDDVAYRIGRAFARYLNARSVVVGCDDRLSSEGLKQALIQGLRDSGTDVIDLGMTGTEEIYFATWFLGVDGGIEITASHNPIDYNGMKLVRSGSQPISGDTGLNEIRRMAEMIDYGPQAAIPGLYRQQTVLAAYIDHLVGYIDLSQIVPMVLVVNAGNGVAGHVIDAIEQVFISKNVPIHFVKIHNDPDGTFPHGIPNPLLPENRADTTNAVLANGANMGIAWDGDFDRCFLFDEHGEFIEGYYIVGLLAESFLLKQPGSRIIYDPRLTWNTEEIITQNGGTPIMSKTGHAFIKERMRAEDAVYGGEMSAHHYFREFAYCDSGMIPWLLVLELLCTRRQPLSELVAKRIARFPSPGEINSQIGNPERAIKRVLDVYSSTALSIDYTDGISLSFDEWRFNLRSSNTEPVVRLNVESRGNLELMKQKTAEILMLLRQEG
jgi:phosphomannomutase